MYAVIRLVAPTIVSIPPLVSYTVCSACNGQSRSSPWTGRQAASTRSVCQPIVNIYACKICVIFRWFHFRCHQHLLSVELEVDTPVNGALVNVHTYKCFCPHFAFELGARNGQTDERTDMTHNAAY